jgi:predicted DNA-binding antitoxin AbrB/MazE fold protein
MTGKPMVIRARYENGVFKPLEKVPLKEGTEADVYPRIEENGEKPRRSVKDFEASGIWKDRTDFKDGLDYENRMRKYRK